MSWRKSVPQAANGAEAAAHADRVLAKCLWPSERQCGLSHLGARDQNVTVTYKDARLNLTVMAKTGSGGGHEGERNTSPSSTIYTCDRYDDFKM